MSIVQSKAPSQSDQSHALAERLNKGKRRVATPDDIEQIEPEAPINHNHYFRNIWQDVPAASQAALLALATCNPPDSVEIARPTHVWLWRRQVLDENKQWIVPVFGRRIREKDALICAPPRLATYCH